MGAQRQRRGRGRASCNHVSPVTRALGALIREERQRSKMGQEVLAAAAGVSQAAVSYLERGITHGKMETIERIAVALGWRFEEFIGEGRRRAGLVAA